MGFRRENSVPKTIERSADALSALWFRLVRVTVEIGVRTRRSGLRDRFRPLGHVSWTEGKLLTAETVFWRA